MLNIKTLPELLTLQDSVCRHLKQPDLFVRLSEREWEEILGENGLVIGFEVDGRLWGFSGIVFPGTREDNLGRDIGLKEDEILRVGHLETAVVHPAFRGNDLQRKMGYLLIKAAQEREGWEYLLNTVSPFNYPSILSTISMKMQIIDIAEKYEGKLRYIGFRNIRQTDQGVPKNIYWVETEDLMGQKELLAKGYRGYDIRKNAAKLQLAYGLFSTTEEGEN